MADDSIKVYSIEEALRVAEAVGYGERVVVELIEPVESQERSIDG